MHRKTLSLFVETSGLDCKRSPISAVAPATGALASMEDSFSDILHRTARVSTNVTSDPRMRVQASLKQKALDGRVVSCGLFPEVVVGGTSTIASSARECEEISECVLWGGNASCSFWALDGMTCTPLCALVQTRAWKNMARAHGVVCGVAQVNFSFRCDTVKIP